MAVDAQMKLLINLARIDGRVAEREKNYIRNIGTANGISPESVDELFEKRHALVIPENLSDSQKFDYIFSLVQLMKIDERIYREEMLFCSKIAANLGFSQEVMFDLLLHVKSMEMDHQDVHELREATMKYLRK